MMPSDSLHAAGYPPPPGGFGPPPPPGGYGAPPPGGYGAPPGGYPPGAGYPPGGYGPQPVPIMYSDPGECALARQALMYAIIGLFCFGPILGAIAVSKARSANMIIAGNPGMRGGGMAQAALILGIVDIVLTVAAIGCNVALSN